MSWPHEVPVGQPELVDPPVAKPPFSPVVGEVYVYFGLKHGLERQFVPFGTFVRVVEWELDRPDPANPPSFTETVGRKYPPVVSAYGRDMPRGRQSDVPHLVD